MNRTREEEERALRGLCLKCGRRLTSRNTSVRANYEGPPLCKDCGILIGDAECERLGGVL